MRDIAALVDTVRRRYDDACFACGRDNPLGLHLDDFTFDEGVVTARFQPRAEYRGTPGVLHGGVAATALDEVLVWAGILELGLMSVTGTLDLRYRKPVDVTRALTVRAWVEERRGRRLRLAGELTDGAAVLVSASGLYLVTDDVSEQLA